MAWSTSCASTSGTNTIGKTRRPLAYYFPSFSTAESYETILQSSSLASLDLEQDASSLIYCITGAQSPVAAVADTFATTSNPAHAVKPYGSDGPASFAASKKHAFESEKRDYYNSESVSMSPSFEKQSQSASPETPSEANSPEPPSSWGSLSTNVPALKIPASMTAEREQSSRKSNRGHQLAYVVALGKEPKRHGKKDSAGAAHHQRVLRSSSRSRNARKNCSRHFNNSPAQHGLYSPSPEPESTDSTMSTDTIPHLSKKRKTKQCKKVQQAAETSGALHYVPPSRGPPTIYDYEHYSELQQYLAQRRKNIVPVSYAAPKLYESFSMNLRTYKLAGNASVQANVSPPPSLMGSMKDLYVEQEEDRRDLRMRHIVEMEKLALSVEQEILRVHNRTARLAANQSKPYSFCTFLQDKEVYSIVLKQPKTDGDSRNGSVNRRLVFGWLQELDDKWHKTKVSILQRHRNEAQTLQSRQRLEWEWQLNELKLNVLNDLPQLDDIHVPIVHVPDIVEINGI